jgi:hypothetical protein
MAKTKPVVPTPIEQGLDERKLALRMIASEATFKEDDYLYDDSFKPGDPSKFRSVHTMAELMECLEQNKDIEAEGIFLEANSDGVYRYKKLRNKNAIQEAWKSNSRIRKFREANIKEGDAFASDGFAGSIPGSNAGLVGDDFVPLLGGPFNKQPYLYDYLRAHAYCFHEYHHHPLARAVVHITRDFVLGRGYRIDCEDPRALALWKAFVKVNSLEEMMEDICREGSIYGENLIWWLPDNEVFIGYQDLPGQEPAKGLIPRIRLLDPSTVWEIVTFPEDIKRVLYYQLVFPTQYQIYTGTSAGKAVPTSKFVMQQLPASDVMHFKYNCVSNEKRGRSDLFPVLGYLKWIRDCINYKLIALKKQSAWTEDITVEGSQTDVDNLTASLEGLGEFEPAGSRFIHTKAITRQYLSNQGRSNGDDETLSWGVSMVAAGSQIPTSYFGLEKSAGQTKASAIVGTEPVAKKFERRQLEIGRILQALWDKFHNGGWGVPGAKCKISFPEIISQDSSAKLKDIKFTEDCGYISRQTAAPLAAKEVGGIDEYDYSTEKDLIDQESQQPISPVLISPLTAPTAAAKPPASPMSPSPDSGSSSAVTKSDKTAVASQYRSGAS